MFARTTGDFIFSLLFPQIIIHPKAKIREAVLVPIFATVVEQIDTGFQGQVFYQTALQAADQWNVPLAGPADIVRRRIFIVERKIAGHKARFQEKANAPGFVFQPRAQDIPTPPNACHVKILPGRFKITGGDEARLYSCEQPVVDGKPGARTKIARFLELDIPFADIVAVVTDVYPEQRLVGEADFIGTLSVCGTNDAKRESCNDQVEFSLEHKAGFLIVPLRNGGGFV